MKRPEVKGVDLLLFPIHGGIPGKVSPEGARGGSCMGRDTERTSSVGPAPLYRESEAFQGQEDGGTAGVPWNHDHLD